MAKKTGVELEFSILDTDFKKAIKEMNSSLSTMRKELNLENEVLKSSSVSIEDYEQKLKTLKEQYDLSTKKVEEATKAYERVKTLYDSNSKEVIKYKNYLLDAKAEQQKISNAIDLTTKSLKEHESELKQDEKKNQEFNSTLGILTSTISKQKEHLEELKKQYIDTVLEQGKSSAKAKELKNEISSLSGEISNSESKISDAEKELQNFSNAEDKAGNHAITFGEMIKANLISDAIKAGIKEITNLVKQFGRIMIDIGKQAFESYADFEQLVGGVETLFKDSSSKVQEYANNAYKTSGLSANQYMETVTSFSASLLQSLNNDTSKAADVANMAIIDMSDNANKMGTSMESIQNAYQGFAKQNYTMLDNLKLGYGGTKSEMERLLLDAEKLTGIKYDINSLNDVYQAIHIIQGELGITGTTAKEATTTIQGSVSSLKAAWNNMLVGIANDNADFSTLISNLIDSLMTAFDNILPRIEIILSGIVQLIVEGADKLLPQIIEIGISTITNLVQGMSSNLPRIVESVNKIVSSLINGLTQVLPQIATVAIQIITNLAMTLIQNLPSILECAIQIILALVDGLLEAIPELIPTIIQAVITIVTTLLDHLSEIIDAGISIIYALIDGIIDSLPILIDALPEIIDKVIMVLTDNAPKLQTVGITLILKLAEGLIKSVPQLLLKIPQIISSIIGGFGNLYKNALDIGKNFITGLWNGINNAKDWILNKIKGFKDSVLNGIKSFFGIHSPSTLFRDEVGKNLALGIGVGFSNEMKSVSENMQDAIPTNFDTNINPNIVTGAYSSNLSTNSVSRNITDTSDYNPGQVAPIYLNIKNFNNNREQDIEDMTEELAYYSFKQQYGKGNA